MKRLIVMASMALVLGACLCIANIAYTQGWNTTPGQDQAQPGQDQAQPGQDQQLAPKESHGSIAYSPTTGKVGKAVNYPTRAAAEQEALNRCGESDCKAYSWFKNACGALARGDDGSGALGWAWDTDRMEAERKAIAQCQGTKGNPRCQVIAWGCATP